MLAPTDPGTRLALGTRLGRPDRVTPPDAGLLTASAARQPSSAAEATQPPVSLLSGAAAPEFARSALCRPRRNQSDSTDSKIGSLLPWPAGPAGGTTTSRLAPPGSLLPRFRTGRIGNRGGWLAPSPLSDVPNAGDVPLLGTDGSGPVLAAGGGADAAGVLSGGSSQDGTDGWPGGRRPGGHVRLGWRVVPCGAG